MSAPRLTETQKLALLKEYRAGVRIKLIAERYGVHESYPAHLARRRGLSRRVERRAGR